MTKILLALLLFMISSCYGINERTSAIANINYACDNADWDKMQTDHSIATIEESSFKSKIRAFNTMPFETELFYFNESPKEIIAISTDHYQIRYIYNPNLSSMVLDGYSTKLDQKEVDRISKRIHAMLEKYGCEENE